MCKAEALGHRSRGQAGHTSRPATRVHDSTYSYSFWRRNGVRLWRESCNKKRNQGQVENAQRDPKEIVLDVTQRRQGENRSGFKKPNPKLRCVQKFSGSHT